MGKAPLYETMKAAREEINKALVDGGLINAPVKHGQCSLYSSDQYPEKITQESLAAGVLAFAVITNIQGGSVADVWLYSLLNKYLREPEKRAEINKFIGHGD